MESTARFAEINSKSTRSEQEKNDQCVARFEKRLAAVEQRFHVHVPGAVRRRLRTDTFLALFVAAFALIITAAQGVFHITSTDPGTLFRQSAALMSPILIVNLAPVSKARLIVPLALTCVGLRSARL